jgi:signal transduction histidine kinase
MKNELTNGNIKEAIRMAGDIKENEEKINYHGKRADSIVKGMLQHSRKSSGQKEPTDINALADEYLRLSYHGLRAKDKSFNATMKTDFDESIGKISVIPQDIGRVLLNLFNNAFYAVSEKQRAESKMQKAESKMQKAESKMPNAEGQMQNAGGEMQNAEGEMLNADIQAYEPMVLISTKKLHGKIEISVKDNGRGIPKNIIDKIFQPFFTTKPTGEGTGLGLSLAYDIIKAHGGTLKVHAKEGEGSEFIIELPIA